MALVSSFLALVQPLAAVMTRPTFASWLVLMTGWLFARHRSLTGILLATGALWQHKHYSSYHRVFSAARWSLDALGLALFSMVLPWVKSVVYLSVDDTRTRKHGSKIYGAGMHHDPQLSSKQKAVLTWGHSWVVLCVVVYFPFAPRHAFSLPILFRLYLNKNGAKKARQRYRSRPQLAVELLALLCSAHPDRRFHALADSSYGGCTVVNHLPANCDLTSRLVLNARLHKKAPSKTAGQVGRPKVRGERLPTPAQILSGRAKRHTLAMYGRKDEVRVTEMVGCPFKSPQRPIKVVATEALRGGRGKQAFFSTNTRQGALRILGDYSGRWSIEETNRGSKTDLGMEEPAGWSRLAVERTAPMAMVLYTLVVLWFARCKASTWRPTLLPWYRGKKEPSFNDMLLALRGASLEEHFLRTLPRGEVRRNVRRMLVSSGQMAA